MSARESALATEDFAAAMAAELAGLARLTDRDAVVLRLADTLACALGAESHADGADSTVTRVRKVTRSQGGGATVWATGEKAATDAAAFRNAVATRYLDYNDTYVARAIVHPSDMTAALVALAEERGIGWNRLIEAVSVAYDVLCRLADQADLRRHGFDGSTLTPLGTAAGAAWLLGLDERGSATALSIAALDAGTLRAVRQGKLSDWKAVASPRGAIKGLFAARMAEAGCRAPDNVFAGAEGFAACISGPLTAGAEAPSRVGRCVIKAFPAQIFIQGFIALAQELRTQLPEDVSEIAAVKVATFRLAVDLVGGHGHPAGKQMNRETADHSAAFAIAAILAAGRLGHDDYEALLGDPAVLALMGKVRLEEDPAASKAFPVELPASMEITVANGRTLSAAQRAPAALDPSGLAAKFTELWPASKPRTWAWTLPGTAPEFPVGGMPLRSKDHQR